MLVAIGLDRRVGLDWDRAVPAFDDQPLATSLVAWGALDGVDEVAVVSTRDRLDVFAIVRFPVAAATALRQALTRWAGRGLPLVELHGSAAFRHLVRLAVGLESSRLGDPQALEQVREAFVGQAGTGGSRLTDVAARAVAAARRVRAGASLGEPATAWIDAVVTVAEKVLGPLPGRLVLALGAGEQVGLAVQRLAAQGAVVSFLEPPEVPSGLAAALEGVDLVLSPLADAPEALLPPAMARLMARRRRRLVLVDLAVPRTIPPATGALEDVFLCDLGDLGRVALAARDEAPPGLAAAERLVEVEVAAEAIRPANAARRGEGARAGLAGLGQITHRGPPGR